MPMHVVDLGPVGVVLGHLAPNAVEDEVVVGRRRVVAQLAVLHDHVRDIDAEPRDSPVEPEAQDPVELIPHVLVPPVQIGLGREEVVEVRLPGGLVELPRRAAEARDPVVGRRTVRLGIGPDVPVPMLRGARRTCIDEPRMLDAGVVRHEVEDDADVLRRRLGNQFVEVVHRAEVGMDVAVVGDVVAPVGVRRRERRAQPDRVDAEPLEMIEVRGDPAQVADPVAVRVGERARVDLVHDGAAPPLRLGHTAA